MDETLPPYSQHDPLFHHRAMELLVPYDDDYCDGGCSDGIDVPVECECLGPLLPPAPPSLRVRWKNVLRRRLPFWTARVRWLPWWAKHPGIDIGMVNRIMREIYLPALVDQIGRPSPLFYGMRGPDPVCTGDPCVCTNGIGCVTVPYERW